MQISGGSRVVSIQGWKYSRVKKSTAKVKLSAPAQDPPVFRCSFSHPRGARRTLCVCVVWARVCSSHPRCLYAVWKVICFGSFPAFLDGSVMPFMPHPHCEPWREEAKPGETEARRQCKELWASRVPILPVQLSWIWKVKFSPLQRCRVGLSQDSINCGEALAWETLSWAKEWIHRGKRLIWADRHGGTAVGCKCPMEEKREGREGGSKKGRYAESFLQMMVFWITLRGVLTQQSQQYGSFLHLPSHTRTCWTLR